MDNGTATDTTDDNLGEWTLTDEEVKTAIDHDHHIHIDFSYNPAAVAH